MITLPDWAITAAVEASRRSLCRSQRGVAVFTATSVIVTGYNFRPVGFGLDGCDRSASCKATCGREAIHAEESCLLRRTDAFIGADMVHVKTVDGQLVASGPPSCVECSKLMLVSGIAGMWLCHSATPGGWQRYPIYDFHRRSIQYVRAGLPRA